VAVVVDTVQSQAGGGVAHVGKKVTEIQPPITDANTPASVIVERTMFLVPTTLKHTRPDVVDFRAFQTVLSSSLKLEAST
jgi:hypothetical protein